MDKFIAHILVVDDDDGIRMLVKKIGRASCRERV